jgi:hypothetical protein
MPEDARAAVERAAREAGVDPSFALAVAQRESDFDPRAHASKTIHGVFQMTKSLRDKHGAGDSEDPYTQAKAWMSLLKNDIRPEMRSVLGRDPTDAEAYIGHHFGSARAARMISRYDPNTPVNEIFSPYEMSLNPHFARAGTSGNLMNSITADIGRRQAGFGGAPMASGASRGLPDLSQYGEPVEDARTPTTPQPSATAALPDLSSYGEEAA